MAGSRLSTLCRQFTALAADTAADAELLARFAANRDEAAFAVLVKRHGPMVWSVCRNLLANAADADDAFQATFVALVRGAKAVRKPEALGAWLHGVAVRVATKLKRTAARRTLREKKAATAEAARPVADSQWDDVLAAVHEEVSKLPDGERTAFIVCCLEGVRQPDAAAQLGWKPGTLTGRLSKAKARLLARLTARGLAPAAALSALGLGATTGQALVPANLLDAVHGFASATAVVPASILQLSHGVLDMTITKVKLLAAAVLVAGGLATGFGASFFASADAQVPAAETPAPAGLPGGPVPGITPVAPKASQPPAMTDPGWMGGGMGGIARGPIARPSEYKFVDVAAMSLDQLKKALATEGDQGWELVTIEHRQFNGSGGIDHIAILKRAKPSAGSPSPAGAGKSGPPPGMMSPAELPPPAPQPRSALELPRNVDRLSPLPAPAGTAPAPANPKLHTFALSSGNSTQMAKVFKELIAIGEFNQEVTAVIADEGSNSLLVKATENGVTLVRLQIDQLEAAAAKRAKTASDKVK